MADRLGPTTVTRPQQCCRRLVRRTSQSCLLDVLGPGALIANAVVVKAISEGRPPTDQRTGICIGPLGERAHDRPFHVKHHAECRAPSQIQIPLLPVPDLGPPFHVKRENLLALSAITQPNVKPARWRSEVASQRPKASCARSTRLRAARVAQTIARNHSEPVGNDAAHPRRHRAPPYR